jgi:glycosyltransferase involved in cell wall biosynthesis
MEKLGIVIPTYQRVDGTTPIYLKRALESIKKQNYQNYHVYLIGDNYENNDEFNELSESIINKDQITAINLPIALERERYLTDKVKLWNCGGVNASNYGIELALKDNIEYICRLDHDDWWERNHLELISKYTDNNIIIATLSRYTANRILPSIYKNPYYPQPCNLIHSSTCIKFSEIPLRYRDVFLEENRIYPSDADLWFRLSDYMNKNNKTGYMIGVVTCNHIEEMNN